jgi:hypothetical protein
LDWEQPEEENGGGLLAFFLAVEREKWRTGMGVGGETYPPQPFNSSSFLSTGSTGLETGSTAPGTGLVLLLWKIYHEVDLAEL